MDQKSNPSEHELKIEKIDKSILAMKRLIAVSERMKLLLEDENFKVAIMENFINKEKLATINRLMNDNLMEDNVSARLIQELRMLKRMENYIESTAGNLENKKAALNKEKQFRAETIKNQNQKGEK